jgi:hypothetical protein
MNVPTLLRGTFHPVNDCALHFHDLSPSPGSAPDSTALNAVNTAASWLVPGAPSVKPATAMAAPVPER